QLCARHGIPVHAPEDVNHPIWVERIRAMEPDFIFSFYYRNLLSGDVLACAKRGAYNLHGSLLPRYRGRAPANWVLVNGETETGVTLHRMVKRADAGPIVAQKRVEIAPDDTALTLHAKLRETSQALLNEVLPILASATVQEREQDESQATTFGRRSAADGELEWSRPAVELNNLVRAVTQPYPGAFGWIGDRKLIVWSAQARQESHGQTPGSVLSLEPLRIACGEGVLEIQAGQLGDNGLYLSGPQLAREAGLV
ncbi:formyltransferase family protein, partial [Pseudomonas sp. GM_Psu_2]|uniref:formyltransferase family protein n=1 Tax=unclassified Pseudomonas TaxID=196821 RepID=UPI00226AB3E7